ncbi:hypothetical protein OAG68_01835 [bacterium]|nr:hypothetical protein [bacterium]
MSFLVRPTSKKLATKAEEIQAMIGGQRFLSDVVYWIRDFAPKLKILETVIQDEFSHDVVVASDMDYFLAYEVT